MTHPRHPTQRTLGVLNYQAVRALLLTGATYDQIAERALVSVKTVGNYCVRTGLAVGKHLRGRRPADVRAAAIRAA